MDRSWKIWKKRVKTLFKNPQLDVVDEFKKSSYK